uniref:uncharacterized protein F54H12.2-like n=1 Tax=Ciona intestinalis TaxID=7719 RepID=UPI000521B1BB|nr:uncharacterized protein F54H12.2-like [Ciona intestinalis]|eukprot:XP_009858221.1 uncharacterized protein F54H12.2-like [Ciona intestinalis]
MTQTSVEDGMWVANGPQNGLSDSGTLEFLISGTKEHYIDLANSYMHIQVKIVNADGTNLAEDAEIAPVNNFFHSLWSQIMLSLNNREVTSSGSMYPYRSYIESLLTFGSAAKSTYLTGALFYKDTPGHMDSIAAANVGATTRRAFAAESKVIDMQSKLHLDMMFQQRYLINNVDVKLKLTRSRDAFVTIGVAGFKIKILAAVLHVRKVKISPSVQLEHITALFKGLCLYQILRAELKTLTIPRFNQSISHDNLFLGQLPRRVILGFVDNDAFNGRLNTFYTNASNGISTEEYSRGFTLYAFDLTPELASSGHFDLLKNGDLSLEAKILEALPTSVNVIIYAEFQNLIQIDRQKSVLTDFSA